MGYELRIHIRAQAEIEDAIDWYCKNSSDAPAHFVDALESAYSSLEINPYFQVRYKDIRSLKLRRFPYSLFYKIDEDREIVQVLSCFHNQQNPSRQPKA